MKRSMISIWIFFSAVVAHPQPPQDDWSWTFLLNGETSGLLFEDTNLAVPVKAAIRDDVSRSYSLAAVSNRFTRLYAPTDPEYGVFVGVDGVEGDYGCAEELSEWKYKLHNGNKFFHVEKELSTKFIQAIALTNQHKVAVGSLTNFLHAFNSTTTNNVVPVDYLQLWWSLDQEVPLSPAFLRLGEEPDFKSEADVVQFCGQFSVYEIIVPSILNFHYTDGVPVTGLWCETEFRRRSDGSYKRGYELVYRDGKWRIALPF